MKDIVIVEESILNGYPIPINIECTNIILEQMKKCICKIKTGKKRGTGFFCYIPDEYKRIPVLITNNHILDEKFLNENSRLMVSFNDEKENKHMKINEKRKIYTNENYDTTIIEIKKEDGINNFLELDRSIFEETHLEGENIYVIQYPGDDKNKQQASVSFGIIEKMENEFILHLCNTKSGSSGSPILNTSNNKIIGIHKGGCGNNKFNVGIDLKYPINEYLHGLNIIKKKKDSKNEIFLNLKIEEDDINKEIYFLDNTNGKYNIGDKEVEHHHDSLKELNEDNTELYIFHAKQKYKKFIIPTKVGNFDISLKFNTEFKDCSFMFYNCSNITNLDLSSFKTKNVTNMSNMFSGCENITNLNLSYFDTKNVTNMNNMFADCHNITELDLSSFDTKNVTNMSYMFSGCDKIINLDLSSFETKNVNNMSNMFYDCKNLKNLNLSNSFDTSNVTNMSDMFYYCSNITNLDLSSFKTKNVTNMSNMFYWCKNLKNLVISNFDTNKATNMSNMFAGCNNLSNLNISSFDIKKDYNTRDMFNYCNMTSIKIKKDSNETLVKQIPNKTTIVKK